MEALTGVREGGNSGSERVAEALMVILHKPFYGDKSAYRLIFTNYLGVGLRCGSAGRSTLLRL